MYDLLLINTHRQLGQQVSAMNDWLGVYSLAAFAEQHGFTARAWGGPAHELPELLEGQMAEGIGLVGFSCDYDNQTEVIEFAGMVRERWNIPVIVGGPQAVGLGQEFLRATRAVALVRGEGEIPLLWLLQYIIDGTGSLGNIPGIVWLDKEGNLQVNAAPPPITDLDALPFIDRNLVLNRDFRRSTASIITARGCPFRCSFCYEGSNTRKVRWRSVANVMAEVRSVLEQEKRIRFVLFVDDTFTLRYERILEFCEQLAAYRRERDFAWFAEAHVQTILHHPDMVARMVEAGLVFLQIGIESGCRETLRAYKKHTTPEEILRTVAICREAGLAILVGNIIVGGAWESRENFARNLDFAKKIMQAGAGMLELKTCFFWPLPNTPMTLHPEQFGFTILDPASKTSTSDWPVVRCGDLEPEDLSQMRQQLVEVIAGQFKALAPTLSTQRMLYLLHLKRRYGIFSQWLEAFRSFEHLSQYMNLLDSHAAVELGTIPVAELWQWHMQRTCTPLVKDGRCFAGTEALSREEFKVFLSAAGRMTMAEAMQYCGMEQTAFLALAAELEQRRVVTFCRY